MNLRQLTLLLPLLAPSSTLAAPTDFDASFGSAGHVSDPFVSAGRVSRLDGRALAISANHRSVIVGGANGGDNVLESAFVGVLLENGAIASDVGTSNSGVSLLPTARFEDLVLLPDGSILACGLHYLSQIDSRWMVARFRADLSLDAGFGDNGVTIGDFGPTSNCHAIEQLSSGHIAITGAAFNAGVTTGFIAVLRPDGQLAPAFGGSGLLQLVSPITNQPVGGGADLGELANGDIYLLSGNRWQSSAAGNIGSHGIRFSASGAGLEAGSGLFGYGFAPFPASSGRIHVDPIGRVRRAGQTARPPVTGLNSQWWARNRVDFLIPNFTAPVEVGSFANNGQILGDVALNGATFGDMVLTPDDRVLVLSTFRNTGGPAGTAAELAIERYRNDSSSPNDPSFSGGGALRFRPPGQPAGSITPWPVPRAIALSRNGRITVMSRRSSGQQGITLSRLVGDPLAQGGGFAITPDSISFMAQSATSNTLAESDEHEIVGLGASARVPLFVLGGEVQINGGPWIEHPSHVRNFDRVRVRGRAPAQAGDTHSVSLYYGGLRAKNSWDVIGPRQRADFDISAQSPLPGVRCSQVGLASNCSAAIPDGSASLVSTLPLEYIVPGQCNFIHSVRVGLDISHPFVGDLRVILEDPNANIFPVTGSVTLIDRPRSTPSAAPGTCSADDVLAVIDARAPVSADTACGLPPDAPALSGELRPTQPLESLSGRRGTGNNGASTLGAWRLIVRDMAASDIGQLNDWSIDVRCWETAPAVADLEVTVTGDSVLVPGTPASFSYTIRNLGPAASGLSGFHAQLPTGVLPGYRDIGWDCVASAGASCSIPASCLNSVCDQPNVNIGMSLNPNATVTVLVSATPDPAIVASGIGISLDTLGQASIFDAIGSTPIDTLPNNNSAVHSGSLLLFADLQALSLTVSYASVGEIEILGRFANQGPSRAPDTRMRLTLPTGYAALSVNCVRGSAACGGIVFLDGNDVVLDALTLLGDGEENVLIVRAGFAGAHPPAGTITLHTELLVPPGMFASDPNLNNNSVSAATPGGVADQIFSDGFNG